MQRLDGLSVGTIIKIVLVTIGLMTMVAVGVWFNVNDLPQSDQTSAWWWFGGITVATTIIAMAYQIQGWRNGSLVLDTPGKRAKHAEQMKVMRGLVLPIGGAGYLLTFIVSPSFYVALGGALAGFFIHLWITLIFRSTKTGHAMRADRRKERQSE